jgi:hypothetical protein
MEVKAPLITDFWSPYTKSYVFLWVCFNQSRNEKGAIEKPFFWLVQKEIYQIHVVVIKHKCLTFGGAEQNSVLRRCAATSGIGPARTHMGIPPLLQSPMGQWKGLAMGQQLIMLCIMGRQSWPESDLQQYILQKLINPFFFLYKVTHLQEGQLLEFKSLVLREGRWPKTLKSLTLDWGSCPPTDALSCIMATSEAVLYR